MHKEEAKQFIGREVYVDLGAEGAYVGTLMEVARNPWRSRVCVTGIEAPAQHFDFDTGGLCRRGYRVGEFVEAAGPAVGVARATSYPTYKQALQAALSRQLGSHALPSNQDAPWVAEALSKGWTAALAAEERREKTGRWGFDAGHGTGFRAGGDDE